MKKVVVCFAALMISLCYAGIEKKTCRIVNLKGAVIYGGNCQSIGDGVDKSIALPNGIFFLKNDKSKIMQKIRVKENEISVVGSYGLNSALKEYDANWHEKNILKTLKKKSTPSEEYYLRTKLLAINGIGYESRTSASANFETLFSYYSNVFEEKFPNDTLDWNVVFNRTSHNKFTDLIQSVYNIIEEAGPDISALGMGLLLYATYEDLKIRLASQFNPVLEEFVMHRDELWNEILESNENTDATLRAELINCADNKMRALVLGHSQGGMYTYNAFNSFSDSVRTHFYSLNVGVPTANNPNWYLINDNDWIVNAARLLLDGIPAGESNGPVSGDECECNNFTHHAWNESYYKSCLRSYAKINAAIENAFRTVPYWEKEKKNAMYQLVWYNGAAQTTIEIAKADGSFVTLGTYHGYNVTDPTIKTVPNVLLQDGVPVLRVMSYHHESWWGPYLSTDPGFFEIISNDDGSLTYLMSDAWSPYSYDDAEFSITLFVE